MDEEIEHLERQIAPAKAAIQRAEEEFNKHRGALDEMVTHYKDILDRENTLRLQEGQANRAHAWLIAQQTNAQDLNLKISDAKLRKADSEAKKRDAKIMEHQNRVLLFTGFVILATLIFGALDFSANVIGYERLACLLSEYISFFGKSCVQ